MDYDNKRGFGKYNQIDVWWRGGGQNGNFSLQLVKFILQSEAWNNAHVRLIIVNPLNEMHEKIYRKAESILNNLRLEAEIKVINNQIDKRSFYDIVQIESVNSDLIFMGTEKVSEDRIEDFVNRINELCLNIGTVVLSNASSSFKDMKVGLEARSEFNSFSKELEIELHSEIREEDIDFPKYQTVANTNKAYLQSLIEVNTHISKKHLEPIIIAEDNIISLVKHLLEESINQLTKAFESKHPELISKKLNHIHSQFMMECSKLIQKIQDNQLDKESSEVKALIVYYLENLKSIISNSPKTLDVTYDLDDIQKKKGDIFDVRLMKRQKRIIHKIFGKTTFKYRLKYRKLLIQKHLNPSKDYFNEFLNQLGTYGVQNIADFGKFISSMDLVFQELQKDIARNGESNIELNFNKAFENLEHAFEYNAKELSQKLDIITIKNINSLNELSSQVFANMLLDEEFNYSKAFHGLIEEFIDIPKLRKRNQYIQLNTLILNSNIFSFSNKLKQIAHEIESKIEVEISESLIANYDEFIKYLQDFLKATKENSDTKFEFDIEELQSNIDQNYSQRLINMSIRRLKKAIQSFPQSIELFTEEADNQMGNNQYSDLETMKISATALLDYMIENHFNGSIKAILDGIPQQLSEYQNHLIDQYRLTSYSLNANEIDSLRNDSQAIEKDSILKMIASQLENIQKDRDELIKLKDNYILKVEERLQNALSSIAIYPFIQAASNLKQYIKQQKSKEENNKIKEWTLEAKKWMQEQFAQIWYRQSQGKILTQELLESEGIQIYQNQELRELYRKLYTNQSIFEKLPFYYRQLFLRRHNFMKEMWVGRENEMRNGLLSIDDYNRGINGGIMIVGERYSGKSFFAQMLALQYIDQDQIITLSPPAAGSTNVKEFKELLQAALDTDQTVEQHLRLLQKKMVIILEDIELWWEKHPQGQEVMIQLHELIRKYSKRVLFISTVNIHAYKIINQINNIEANYLSVINMGAMDAQELNEMIMKRHNTSGLKFIHKKKTQEQFHTWDYAKLFNKYFNFSRGIPGIAVHAWVNNILDIEDKTIVIRYPNTPHIEVFDQLTTEQNWHLLLFVLHKNMSLDKFSRLTNFTKHEAFLEIEKMLRKGLIYKTDDNIFRINILIHHLIVQHLQDKRLL